MRIVIENYFRRMLKIQKSRRTWKSRSPFRLVPVQESAAITNTSTAFPNAGVPFNTAAATAATALPESLSFRKISL
jgi:hypothetical protein